MIVLADVLVIYAWMKVFRIVYVEAYLPKIFDLDNFQPCFYQK